MKLRNLLPCLLLGASLTASAKYDIYFRDGAFFTDGVLVSNSGGHMDFPNENGAALFNEDGSITATSNQYADGGLYFRTKKLTSPVPEGHDVFAFDYKSNRNINNIVLFAHEGFSNDPATIVNGPVITVADDYQTFYMIVDWSKTPGWGSETDYARSYFWVSSNDQNAKDAGWEITLKNIRLLTLAEATEEAKNAATSGVISDGLTPANADFGVDFDEDMDGGSAIFMKSGANPILQSANLIKPLPAGCTTFNFDYKLTGESFAPKFYFHKKADYTEMTGVTIPEGLVLEGTPEDVDPYETPWKTFSVDLSEAIAENNFASVFGSNHFLWIQFMELGEDQMLWIKNVRWTNPSSTGIDEITFSPERPADNRIFNLMGIECKGDLAPGIYIQNGKKFVVK